VLKQLEPDRFTVEEARRPFLDAGHNLQQFVEDFIRQWLDVGDPQLDVSKRESEGIITNAGWTIVGHIDGAFEDRNLLEVKAIKDHNFVKLAKNYDWRDQYGHYQSQAQTYQKMFDAPGSHFVYFNRNTADMLGSLPIEHPAYTYRKDMYEPHDPALWNAILEKMDAAARFIEDGEAPSECDAKGYCFFCGVRGTTMQSKRMKRIGLLPDDEEYSYITDLLGQQDGVNFNLKALFKELNADEISLLHPNGKPEILRKEDYEL
jgi:hypothetical protein